MQINEFYSRSRKIFISSVFIIFVITLIITYGFRMLGPKPEPKTTIPTIERGSILDRNGKLLAIQTTLYNIAITRSSIADKQKFASALSPVCNMPESEIENLLNTKGSDFFYLKKKISEAEKNSIEYVIKTSNLRGIRLEQVVSRTYPENKLASHLIGFLGDDGIGLAGAEYSFQELLSPIQQTISTEPVDAYNIVLTIDSSIQYQLEKLAEETMDSTQAEAVMMIALEAKTGEILAYVSEPSTNLNQFSKSTDAERFDRPALYAYEPGSVFKIFSISAALELGFITDKDLFYCDGGYSFTTAKGEKIQIKCLDKHGWLSARDVIKYSCNDGTGQIVEKIPNDVFENKLRQFGFGSKTGLEVPSETAGLFSRNSAWSLRSKPTIAIGQEISVSALQMVEAATALANKGEIVQITLLSKIFSKDGTLAYSHQATKNTKVISRETAQLMLSYMEATSETGTGIRASVGDLRMAVKTGTAQLRNPGEAGYSQTDFISSCMGIFPVEDPKIIIYLAIVKPVGETYGGRIAAPVISKASNIVIDQMGLSRGSATSIQHSGIIQIEKNKPVSIGDVVPNFTGISKRMLTGLLERQDIKVKIMGDGYVVRQNPEPGTMVEKGMTIDLFLE